MVSVETDDPVTSKITFTVTADVIVELDFERPSIGLPTIKTGEQTEAVMPVLSAYPELLKFGNPVTNIPGLTAKIVRGEKEGKPFWSLNVVFKGENVGNYAGTVKVPVLQPKAKELVLSVAGRVEGFISVWPQVLSMRKPADSTPPSSTVTIKAEKGTFKITQVSEPAGKVNLKQETVVEGKEYKLTATLKEEALKEDKLSTKIIVKTNDRKQPELEIPLYYSGTPLPYKPSTITPSIPNPKKILKPVFPPTKK